MAREHACSSNTGETENEGDNRTEVVTSNHGRRKDNKGRGLTFQPFTCFRYARWTSGMDLPECVLWRFWISTASSPRRSSVHSFAGRKRLIFVCDGRKEKQLTDVRKGVDKKHIL